jgi:hypothetical protein
MRARLLLAGAVLFALAGLVLALGRGVFGEHLGAGEIEGAELPRAVVRARAAEQRSVTERSFAPPSPETEAQSKREQFGGELGGRSADPSAVPRKSVLFGDLHVHTAVSLDAFLMSLPIAGGEGAHPAADACDFARYCSALDFWSLNDHAEAITPQLWQESVESIRQCNAVAGDPNNPDVVSYLGWEWTQVGGTPETHFGHRNVVLRDLADAAIPPRPIAAASSRVGRIGAANPFARGVMVAARMHEAGTHDLARKLTELQDAARCPEGVPTRELPRDCLESAATPGELMTKLREWESAALVIPHGTAWGWTASPLASWETQLGADAHDPAQQRLIEVYSGHGNSEEYRAWRPLARGANGEPVCPSPTRDYTPLCWRAGEIIEQRCLANGGEPKECAERAEIARAEYAKASGGAAERGTADAIVPLASGDDWLDAGQCRDCFLPAFQLRPLLSVQAALALTSFRDPDNPWRYRFGFIAASDVHSARPGTGYKEFARQRMVDGQRDGVPRAAWTPPARLPDRAIAARDAKPRGFMQFAAGPPDDRIGSMLFTGGLVAVHAASRERGAIWDAMQRREVYGTSGQRTLLWFDLVNAPGGAQLPMGSETQLRFAPHFRVRAIGSPKQAPGCPDFAASGLPADRLQRLCLGECFNPSGERHLITRIEVVRIRPQQAPGEPLDDLIEDPWRVFQCEPNATGCAVEFADEEFAVRARDAVYYVRAIEEPTPAVNGAGLACTRDARGECTAIAATPQSAGDDRLALVEERAWSSPIFVDYVAASATEESRAPAVSPDAATSATPTPAAPGDAEAGWSVPAFED